MFLPVVLMLLGRAYAPAIAVRAPCESPFVFPEAAVNVVVMPYTQPEAFRGTNPRVGQQLAALVELEALLGIAKFGSVGLIQVVGDSGCTPDVVLDKLLGKRSGATRQLAPGHGVILVWGRIFQSGSDLYLQSYVRFLRRDVVETATIAVKESRLSGRLSSQALACAARKISLTDLEAIQKQFATSNLLRISPDLRAAFVPIPDEGGPYSFWITRVQGDWVELQPMSDKHLQLKRGWVRARSEVPEWSLRRRMPELALVEGAAGYLAARVSKDGAPAAFDAASAALAQYLEHWNYGTLLPSEDAPGSGLALAVAIPEQLRGFVALLRSEVSNESLAAANAHFAAAQSLIPFSADARNLATMTRVALAFREKRPDQPPARFVGDLLAAASVEPDNRDVLANLQNLYGLVLTSEPVSGDLPGPRPEGWRLTDSERQEFQRQSNDLQLLLKKPPALLPTRPPA